MTNCPECDGEIIIPHGHAPEGEIFTCPHCAVESRLEYNLQMREED
jgi:DNA-directed RNA polymerase subunit M/transcription elongation factor TFIIS